MKSTIKKTLGEPIFVLGNPRSGTTMFRLMLTSHKNIMIPPECGFVVWLFPKFKHWHNNGDQSICRSFIQEVLKSRKFETWQLTPEQLTAYISDRQPVSYTDAVSAVYEAYGTLKKRTFSRWGDKNNWYIDHITTLIEMFPRAYYVHIVRDGRNVACSYMRLSQRKLDSKYAPQLPAAIETIAAEWRDNVNKILTPFKRNKKTRFYEIRFEDIVLNTQQSLTKLCQWLDEEYDPAMIEFYHHNDSQSLEPKEFLQWKAKTLKPVMATEVDRYRRELSPPDLGCFETIAGAELERYHYPLF